MTERLNDEITQRRNDPEFMARLQRRKSEDAHILSQIADNRCGQPYQGPTGEWFSCPLDAGHEPTHPDHPHGFWS